MTEAEAEVAAPVKDKDEAEDEHQARIRKRDMVGEFLKKNLTAGELAIKHSAGLGHVANAVPETDPVHDGQPRPVEVGWHPVGGFAGKWFAEQTGLGKMITEKINNYPDPTQHWAVLVGDYVHQLWMDENFDVIYTNGKIVREEWHTFTVGHTRFNDDAIRRTGESVIQTIRDKTPAYNLISNNCQTYALQLLDAIKAGIQKEFATTLDVYDKLVGPGSVKDLFSTMGAPEEGTATEHANDNSVSIAQEVMTNNTNQLDPKDHLKGAKDAKKTDATDEAKEKTAEDGDDKKDDKEDDKDDKDEAKEDDKDETKEKGIADEKDQKSRDNIKDKLEAGLTTGLTTGLSKLGLSRFVSKKE